MRAVKIPADVLRRMHTEPMHGRAMLVPVQVNWPELRLTESQRLANAIWSSGDRRTERPFPDHSIFDIEIPYIPEMLKRENA